MTVTANGNPLAPNTVDGKAERGLSTATIAARLNRSTEQTAQLLAESEDAGIVQAQGGGWRLSDEAERRFGQALRCLALPRDGLEVPAGGNTG